MIHKAACFTLQKLAGPAAATATLSYVYYHHSIPVAHAKQQSSSFFSESIHGNNNNNSGNQASLQHQRTIGGAGTTTSSTLLGSSRPPLYVYNNDPEYAMDLTKVREAIRKVLEDDMEKRGDGTSLYGTLVYLAWICAATYNADSAFHQYYSHHLPQQPHVAAVGGTHGAPARLRQMEAEKSTFMNSNNTIRYPYQATLGSWKVARDALEPVKAKFPQLSYADLYAFASVVAVEEAGGPRIPFRLGRVDNDSSSIMTSDAPSQQQQQQPQQPQPQPSLVERLPEADKGSHVATIRHIRQVFHRMGFNDQEIVALCGAHTLGRCHTTRSGYWGPFTMFENSFDNDYFRLLMQHEQQEGSFWTRKLTHNGKPWIGPDQYEETGSAALATNAGGNGNQTSSTNGNNSSISSGISGGGQLCRMPSDMVLLYDPEFKKWVEVYAKDRNRFFHDFAKAFAKLLELGVPFDPPKPWWKRWFLFFL